MLTRTLDNTNIPTATGAGNSWESVLTRQPSFLSTNKEPAKASFAKDKSVEDCKGAALTATLSTFFVKLPGVKAPAIVHGFVECRSTDPEKLGEKSYGVHHGTDARAAVFTIDAEDFFTKLKTEDPLDFDNLCDIDEPQAFLEAAQVEVKDGKVPISDMRHAILVPPELAGIVLNSNIKAEDHTMTIIDMGHDGVRQCSGSEDSRSRLPAYSAHF